MRVIELASGKERRPLPVDHGETRVRVATSPIDYTVASGYLNHTVLISDLTRPAQPRAKMPLNDDALAALWRALAGADALAAEEAIEALVQAPGDAVRYLWTALKPAAPPEAPRGEASPDEPPPLPNAATLQALCGLEVLEKIGTRHVLPVIESLAGGALAAPRPRG
jgi:hypothetical protein